MGKLVSQAKKVLVKIDVSGDRSPTSLSQTPTALGETPSKVKEAASKGYKFHRRWELMLQALCEACPVAAILNGPCSSPPLLELFFAADARAIAESVEEVGFGSSGFIPGPFAMRCERTLRPPAAARRSRSPAALVHCDYPICRAASPCLTASLVRRFAACSHLSHLGFATARGVIRGTIARDVAIRRGLLTAHVAGGEAALLQTAVNSFSVRKAAITTVPGNDLLGLNVAFPRDVSTPLASKKPVALITGLSLTLPGVDHEFGQEFVCKRLGLAGTKLADIYSAEHIERRTIADLRTSPNEPGQGELTSRPRSDA